MSVVGGLTEMRALEPEQRLPRGPLPGNGGRGLVLHVLVILLVLGLVGQEAAGQAPEPGSELTVYLMTMEPGDHVWERFGHNAIWISDSMRRTELTYSWGFFDFRQVDFIPRFLKGRMLYLMGAQKLDETVSAHKKGNRSVTVQKLNLTPAQRLELKEFVDWNAKPENRFYRYDYFLDNCSTRVRDVLDQVLDGQIKAAFETTTPGVSYRHHTRRLTQPDMLLYAGMDLLLGSRGDRPISVWDEMFVPMVIRDEIRDLTIRKPDGEEATLVLSERALFEARRDPEPVAPRNYTLHFLTVGLMFGGMLAGLAWMGARVGAIGRIGRASFLLLAGAWSLLAGLLGLILVAVLFTDHQFMFWNENLFQANPLSLGLVGLLTAAVFGGKRRRAAFRLSVLVASIALLGFLLQVLPGFDQNNGQLIALTLPVHLSLALSLRSAHTLQAPLPSR